MRGYYLPETGGKKTARIPRKMSDPHISTIRESLLLGRSGHARFGDR